MVDDATIELQLCSHDPFQLRLRKLSKSQLKKIKNRSEVKFYEDQNDLIEEMLAPVEEKSEADAKKENLRVNFVIYGSLIANVLLFIIKLICALSSGSLVIFATMADSFMDLLSGFILLIARRLAKKKEIYRYPSGKSKYETVGIIIYGTLMATLSIELIVNSMHRVLGEPEKINLGILSLLSLVVVLIVKFVLYISCRLVDNPSAHVLSMDHRNDLILNGLGLCFGLLGKLVYSLLDPIGAIIIAILILRSWTLTVLEHTQLIVGVVADSSFLNRITYIAMTHDERIRQVDTVRAYHAGSKVIVEVDIVLPPETTLKLAHDLGESLEDKLESLPNVDRAFVHVDYESTHKPEHSKCL